MKPSFFAAPTILLSLVASSLHADDLQQRVEDALGRAGQNRVEVESFLSSYDGEELLAARFLVANMPTVDLADLTAAELRSNLDLAFSARREMPYGEDVPFNLFLHYVLPHRMAQEAFEPWRGEVYASLQEPISSCDNMVDAALAVNRWCGARIGFKQTEFRDQDVMSTLRAGYGRCEEMMIACIGAMRSVGIPARPCSTPWWAVTDNNHAWVEVWTDGDWHYIGGCEPGKALDQAWFSGSAKRAGLVVSTMYGRPEGFETGERVYRVGEDTAYINSTDVYSMTGEIDVLVLDDAGTPVTDCPLTVSIFNFGALRTLTQRTTDRDGRCSVVAGLGDFLVSAGTASSRDHAIVRVKPGAAVNFTLELGEGKMPPEAFWLRRPSKKEAGELASLRVRKGGDVNGTGHAPQLPAKKDVDRYAEEIDLELDATLSSLSDSEAEEIAKILDDSLGNWRNIAASLVEADESSRSATVQFLKRTTHLDRLQMTPEVIADHVGNALVARRGAYDEATWHEHVLGSLVDIEHLSPWRDEIAGRYADCSSDGLEETVAQVRERLKQIQPMRRGRYGPIMNPGQVERSGRGTRRERVIHAVGVLRSLGIAARKAQHQELVEWNDGSEWRRFDPTSNDEETVSTGAEEDGSNSPAGDGHLSLSFEENGESRPDFEHWSLARYGSGGWESLRNLRGGRTDAGLDLLVPAGRYLASAGIRNGNGDVWIVTREVVVKTGEREECVLSLDAPPVETQRTLPVVRDLKNEVLEKVWPAADRPEGPGLLVVATVYDEPSLRMVPIIAGRLAALRERGVAFRLCLLSSGGKSAIPGEWKELGLAARPVSFEVAIGLGLNPSPESGDSSDIPSVLFFDEAGTPVLWTEGYDLGIGVLIDEAADRIVSP